MTAFQEFHTQLLQTPHTSMDHLIGHIENLPKSTLSKNLLNAAATPREKFFWYVPTILSKISFIASFPKDLVKKMRQYSEQIDIQPGRSRLEDPSFQSLLQLFYILEEIIDTDYQTESLIEKVIPEFQLTYHDYYFYLQEQIKAFTNQWAQDHPDHLQSFLLPFIQSQIKISDYIPPKRQSSAPQLQFELPPEIELTTSLIWKYIMYLQNLHKKVEDTEFIDSFLEEGDDLTFDSPFEEEIDHMKEYIYAGATDNARKTMLRIQKRNPNWAKNPHFLATIALMYYENNNENEESTKSHPSGDSTLLIRNIPFTKSYTYSQQAIDESMAQNWDRYDLWKGFVLNLGNLGFFHTSWLFTLYLLEFNPHDFDLLINCGQCAYQLEQPYEAYFQRAHVLDSNRFSDFLDYFWVEMKIQCNDDVIFAPPLNQELTQSIHRFNVYQLLFYLSQLDPLPFSPSQLADIRNHLPFALKLGIHMRPREFLFFDEEDTMDEEKEDEDFDEDIVGDPIGRINLIRNILDSMGGDHTGSRPKNLPSSPAALSRFGRTTYDDKDDVVSQFLSDTIELNHSPSPSIFQLKIMIRHAHPTIWRRILIRSDRTLEDLHDCIQDVFDWGNYHLHEFYFSQNASSNRSVCVKSVAERESQGPVPFVFSHFGYYEDGITIGEILGGTRKNMSYLYDFGDNWDHKIVWEASYPLAINPDFSGPICIKAVRMAPLEDFGGIYAFSGFLQYLKNVDEEQQLKNRPKKTSQTASTRKKSPKAELSEEDLEYFEEIREEYGDDLEWNHPTCDVIPVSISKAGKISYK